MKFLYVYLGEGKGGGALMHVYVWEHIVGLYYRATWLILMKLGKDEVLKVSYLYKAFLPRGRSRAGPK